MDKVQLMEAQLLAESFDGTHNGVNKYLEIDSESRTIKIPSDELLFGVVTDDKVERKYFRCPRIVGDNIDLYNLNLRVLYENANGEKDKCIINDCEVEGDYITFSWLVEGKPLKYSGTLNFAIAAVNVDEDGLIQNAWNTTLATGTVLGGIEVEDLDESEETEARDVLQQLLNLMDAEVSTRIQEVKDECADQITNIKNESTKQQEVIANKGLETLNSIPEDYTAMSNTVDDLTKFSGSVIKQEVEGKSIVVNDSSKMPLLGLQMFGKSEQISTEGNQLISITQTNPRLLAGLTLTPSDGDITISGKHTSDALWAEFGKATLEAGKTYVLSCREEFAIHVWDLTNKVEFRTKKVGVSSITIEMSKTIECAIVLNDATLDKTYYNERLRCMLSEGVEALPWEPYTGGKPSPNPEYPQDIISIENPSISIYSENLFNKNTIIEKRSVSTSGGGLYTNDASFVTDYIKVNGLRQLITNMKSSVSGFLWGAFYNSNKAYISGFQVICTDSAIIEIPINAKYIRIACVNELLDTAIVALGNELPTYDVYVSPIEATINKVLLGVPVESGGNYTDENGQQWIADYRDWERGVDVRLTNTITINGKSAVHKNTEDVDNYLYYMYITDGIAKSKVDRCLCDRLYCKEISTIISGNSEENCGMYLNSTGSILYFNIGYCLSENSIESVKSVLDEKPLTLIYAIETPIETPIPEDELQAYRELHTNYPNTTILNDSGAYMKLTYGTDTKTYIDNKFAELQAALTKS